MLQIQGVYNLMKTLAALISIVLIVLSPVVAPAAESSFTEAIMKSTFMIAGPNSQGTAFILGKPDSNNKCSFFVLITAAHVLEGINGETATLFLRTREGDTYKKLPLQIPIRSGMKPLWKRHPEVDVAVMPVLIPRNADIFLASTDLLATDEVIKKLNISAGEEVLVLGFPYGAEANDAGFPILRSGRIASFPLTPTANVKTFLLDFPVFSGNSGSPVIIDQEFRAIGGAPKFGSFISVLGIVSQEKSLTEQVKSLEELQFKTHKLGIAVVVHGSFVSELVNSLEFPTNKCEAHN
jgi:S1-C subfamily serine protease